MNTPRSNLDDRLQIGGDNLRRHFAVRRSCEAREIGIDGYRIEKYLNPFVVLGASLAQRISAMPSMAMLGAG
jgi:hypothetical protein